MVALLYRLIEKNFKIGLIALLIADITDSGELVGCLVVEVVDGTKTTALVVWLWSMVDGVVCEGVLLFGPVGKVVDPFGANDLDGKLDVTFSGFDDVDDVLIGSLEIVFEGGKTGILDVFSVFGAALVVPLDLVVNEDDEDEVSGRLDVASSVSDDFVDVEV